MHKKINSFFVVVVILKKIILIVNVLIVINVVVYIYYFQKPIDSDKGSENINATVEKIANNQSSITSIIPSSGSIGTSVELKGYNLLDSKSLRRVLNPRPLLCESSDLPLIYEPKNVTRTASRQIKFVGHRILQHF